MHFIKKGAVALTIHHLVRQPPFCMAIISQQHLILYYYHMDSDGTQGIMLLCAYNVSPFHPYPNQIQDKHLYNITCFY